jgi:fatty acid desaturase
MRLYRFKEDVPASLWILLVLSVQLFTFFCIKDLYVVAGVMLALLACSASAGSISHNHHHTHTFTRPWLNRVYEVVMFLETGVLPYAWTLHHNLGHHKHYLEPELDTSAWQHKNGRVMHRVYYDVVNAALIYPQVCHMGRQHPEVYRRFKFWAVISLAVLGVFFLIDPLKALVLFVVPMPLMFIGLLDNTYMQHSDLDISSPYTASRNSFSGLYNRISWNLGYHTAHHLRPNLHWSKLPEFHAQIAERIPAGVQCHSLLLSACSYRHSRDAVPAPIPAPAPVVARPKPRTPVRGEALKALS